MEVCILKIELAKEIIENCLEQNYMIRDNEKMNKSLSAVKHQEELLKEMGIILK